MDCSTLASTALSLCPYLLLSHFRTSTSILNLEGFPGKAFEKELKNSKFQF